jgi:hypothetical protein
MNDQDDTDKFRGPNSDYVPYPERFGTCWPEKDTPLPDFTADLRKGLIPPAQRADVTPELLAKHVKDLATLATMPESMYPTSRKAENKASLDLCMATTDIVCD